MKTLKIEPSLHNLLRRKAVELDSRITVLANRWMTMGAYYDGHLASTNLWARPDMIRESCTVFNDSTSPTATKP